MLAPSIYILKYLFTDYLVADESHATVMGPREANDRRVSIVDELDWPSSLVFDPDENDSGCITGGQLLVRFIPAHQSHLQ